MAESLTTRIKNGWSAFSKGGNQSGFLNTNQHEFNYGSYGTSYGSRPDRVRFHASHDKSIISSIYTRIGIDVASIEVKHVKVDQNGRYVEAMKTGLNECLTLEANIDQAARAFRQDAVMTLFDKGTIAIVPVDTDNDPTMTNSYDIKTLRVGEITTWYPKHVKVNLYNENKGVKEEVTLPKSMVAIVENPLYSVMNEPNSTLQRLIRKLALLDSVDEQASSGKLDIIIQLPYVIKSEARQQQADKRRKDLEMQLKDSKYGIGYTDGTEKITQLNRPAENNMLKQVEYLTEMLYGQLGLTADVFTGTADEKTMLNYHNRTIEPVLAAITQAMKRSFLTKTARSQGQSVEFFRDPFKNVAVGAIAEIADKFTRNEVLTSNEIRSVIGFKPSTDPKAEKLVNSNMPQPIEGGIVPESEEDDGSDPLAEIEATLDQVMADLEADDG